MKEHDDLIPPPNSDGFLPPHKMLELDYKVMSDAGKMLTEKDRMELIHEAGNAACKMLIIAFKTCSLETHIDMTFEVHGGERFRIRFEKVDPLI